MLTKLLSLAVQTGHKELMKALVESVKGIGHVPSKVRLYSSEKDFDRMTKSLKTKYKDTPEVVDSFSIGEYKITATTGYKEDRPDLVYTYIYAPDVKLPETEKYTSVFVGVGMTPKSFGMQGINVLEKFGDVNMYTVASSPKCIRYGVMGAWNDEDRKYLEAPKTTALF